MQGAYAYDVDGNKYIDYVGTWGPAICGHANPEVSGAEIFHRAAALSDLEHREKLFISSKRKLPCVYR